MQCAQDPFRRAEVSDLIGKGRRMDERMTVMEERSQQPVKGLHSRGTCAAQAAGLFSKRQIREDKGRSTYPVRNLHRSLSHPRG